MNDELSQIRDDERKFFFILPNLIDDLKLSPAAFRLYCHYKRRAGDNGGTCWESVRHTAEVCRLSKNTVVAARKELERLGLIEVLPQKWNNGRGFQGYIITITDIWQRNFEAFQK